MNLKLAIRHLLKNRVYALISILGLAVGISACLLISLNVFHELSYDQYHSKKDRIYRVSAKLDFNGEVNAALSSLALGPTLMNDYPEVENYARFRALGQPTIKYGDQIFNEIRFGQTDSSVFNIFDIELVQGDPSKALSGPTSVVISEEVAHRIFGDEDPMNKVINMGQLALSVTGVMKDPPMNSEFQFDAYILLDRSTVGQQWDAFEQDWFRISFYTYILFNGPVDEDGFSKKLVEFEEKYVKPWAAMAGVVAGIEYNMISLANLHFDNSKEYDNPKANPTYLKVFALLAVFILLIASINFINLALAQSSKRAKEVGVRKTLGVGKGALISQFLTESILITLIALVLGIGIVEVLLQPYNVLINKEFVMGDVFSPQIIVTIAILVLVIGFGAGSYPALVMSRFEPVKVLKGNVPKSGGIGLLRKVLILVQFAFSLFMITGTLLIQDQMSFIAGKDLGFDKENIVSLVMPNDAKVREKAATIMTELRNVPGVEKVAFGAIPTGQTGQLMFRVQQDEVLKEKTLKFIPIEEEFIALMGIDILKGRNFSKEIATDQQQAFIINETAAREFGWGENALGKRMQWGLEANDSAANDGVVVGVVSDFHFNSLHTPLEPVALIYQPGWVQGQITMRLEKGAYKTALTGIENKWAEMAEGNPINFRFFDESLARNYENEERMQKVFKYFSVISILLALLGLFALVSFAVETKTKEIGMRKILGANIGQLTWLVVRDFFISIAIAFVLTAPVNYFFMQEWLQEFAYKTPIHISSFLLAFLFGLLLSTITVLYHTVKISRSDPVTSLRYE